MKFSVGLPMLKNDDFIERIIACREGIYEVYFSFGGYPSGRGSVRGAESEPVWAAQSRQLDELSRLSEAGIPLNLLLNAGCFGADALSRAFFVGIGETLDRLASRYPIRSVTTTSPLIGKFIHENFTGIEVRASVNLGIGSTAAMDYTAEYYDGYYLKRELNRQLDKIHELRDWCDKNRKGLFMLANSGCLNDCSARAFHDNMVAHETEIAKMDNAYAFTGVCREYLKSPEKRISLIRDMNYVRPEDMGLYEGLFTAAKLATRVNPRPERILDAYLGKRYVGAVTDLLEPDNGASLLPAIVDNSRFPADFGERVAVCDKRCADCGYCGEVLKKALVELATDENLYI